MFLTMESKTYKAGSFLCGGTCHKCQRLWSGRKGAREGRLWKGSLGSSRTVDNKAAVHIEATYFLDMLLQGLCNWKGIVGQVSSYLGQVGDLESRVHGQAIQGALVVLDHLGRLVLFVV
jgi:hypothetical protein